MDDSVWKQCIDRGLVEFCKSINGGSPVPVPLEPEPWAIVNYSFLNLERNIPH